MRQKYKKERKLFRKSSYAWAFLAKANVLMKSFKITFQRKVVVATRSQCPIGFLCIILFFIFLLLLLNVNYTLEVCSYVCLLGKISNSNFTSGNPLLTLNA
jgi:hypothetical protein